MKPLRRALWAMVLSISLAVTPNTTCWSQTRLVLPSGGGLSTIAGTGDDGRTINGTSSLVNLASPAGLVYDTAGNLYVADSRNHQIDRITPSGTLTVYAGTGAQGMQGDGGPASVAELNTPTALTLRKDGSLIFADTGNHRIRKIDAAGVITTIVGTGEPGFSGDGGTAITARLRSPGGLALDPDGSLFIADTGNHRIRKLTVDGHLITVAGTGVEADTGDGGPAERADLRAPGALQMLPDGRLLIADRSAHRIRALLPAGTMAAYVTQSTLRGPEGMGVDAVGNLLIADAAVQAVLQVGPDAGSVPSSTALAGTGKQGRAQTGPANGTSLDSPSAVVTNGNGDVVISDRRNHQVQRVALPSLTYGDIPAGSTSAAQSLTLANGSTAALRIASLQLPSGFSAMNGGTCAAFPLTLAPAATCTFAIAFAPGIQGLQSGYAQVQTSGMPAAAILLTGTGSPPGNLTRSVTTLQSNGNISYAGSPVLLSARVTGALQAGPIGNVSFLDGAESMGTVPLQNGLATLSTANMLQGNHKVHAAYSGDAIYRSSASSEITQTVVPAPDFLVTTAASSYTGKPGDSIAIPIAITPANGTLNHALQLVVSGLPAGFTSTVTPNVFTLGANPINVSVEVRIPTVVALEGPRTSGFVLAGLAAAFPLLSFRLRRNAPCLLALLVVAALCAGGCGGGFRSTSTPSVPTTTPKTFRYTAVVTATATGVLGDALTHSTSIGLVVTQ